MVQLRKIFHNGNYQIGLYFGFNEELKHKAKIIGARWSQTYKCWYVLYNKENYKLILHTFDTIEIAQDKNNERHTEPAALQHENVHIAEIISEIQQKTKAEHKGSNPEIAGDIVFKGSLGKYWILKAPYKEGITPKLMDIKGVYWNKTQKAFFILRHVNVKIKVEALLGIGEIFPPEYFNMETVISNQNTFIELNAYPPDKKWMLLKYPSIPYLIEQVKRWEGSRYSKANGTYMITATPDMLDNLQRLVAELNISIHNNLPERYLSKYKAINRKASQMQNLREQMLQTSSCYGSNVYTGYARLPDGAKLQCKYDTKLRKVV